MKNWRILPTPLGLGFVALILVLLLIAINFSNNLIFTLSFFMSSALLLSAWFSARNIKQIDVVNIRVKPVHSGQKLQYQIAVKEQGNSDHLYLQLEPQRQSKRQLKKQPQSTLQSASQFATQFFHLSANAENLWHLNLDTQQRGIEQERPLVMSCTWPLGLVSVRRVIGTLPEVLVYPQAQSLLPLQDQHSGQAAHSQAEAEELDGLREYQAGDNIKRIDWRAMARRQQLQVKHFDGADGDPSLWLDWQQTQGLPYEQRISCLCHWILECQQTGREYGLRLPNLELAPQRDAQHTQQCLSALALLASLSSEQTPEPEQGSALTAEAGL